MIESDFQLLKDETIIRFRPIRHWTDTKIRAHAFCCVMALMLMRVMQWKAHVAGYTMSPQFLKDELSDIQVTFPMGQGHPNEIAGRAEEIEISYWTNVSTIKRMAFQ